MVRQLRLRAVSYGMVWIGEVRQLGRVRVR